MRYFPCCQRCAISSRFGHADFSQCAISVSTEFAGKLNKLNAGISELWRKRSTLTDLFAGWLSGGFGNKGTLNLTRQHFALCSLRHAHTHTRARRPIRQRDDEPYHEGFDQAVPH